MLPGILRLLIALCAATSLRAATVTLTVPRASATMPCVSHVVEDGAMERVAPCGEPVITGGKHAVAWVEMQERITPFLTEVTHGGRFEVSSFVPAGAVLDEHARVVSLVAPRGALFVRDVAGSARIPAGRAIALKLDERGRAVSAALIEVPANGATRIDVREHGVVAWLSRPRAGGEAVAVRLDDREPDGFVSGTDAVVAFWRNLQARTARITVDSPVFRVSQDVVNVAALIEEPLVLLPRLDVRIGDARVHELTLAIRNADQTIRKLAAKPGQELRIDSLPAALLTLSLDIDGFVLQRHIDLTSGQDTSIDIPLHPITVSGNVFLGDAPARASMRFLQEGDAVSAETDPAGAYEVTLWQPRRYIVETTLLDQSDLPPLTQDVGVDSSRTLDVHIPRNALSARVYDASSGAPVAEARIVVHNKWNDESGMSSRIVTLNTTGEITRLPPLRPGTAEISATATGYESTESMTIPIDDTLRTRVLDIPMRHRTGDDSVQIRIGSAPASGAEVAAWAGDELSWRGLADDSGRVAVPAAMRARRLIVRHPAAASMVVFALDPDTTITLDPSAPPLAVNVGSAARLTLWLIGGVRLSGPEASFATWSSELPSDGIYVLKGLNRRPLRILATQRATNASLDALATTIPFPWPALARLTP